MKAIQKKVLTCTLAAGLLIGGGLTLQHTQAFADESGTTTATSTPTSNVHKDQDHKGSFANKQGFGFKRGDFQGGIAFGKEGTDVAAILGIDQATLKDELKSGKSLAEIAQEKANLTEDALIQKLTDAETKKLDDAVAAGKLTQAQADKAKSGMADRLKKMVEAKPQAGSMKGGPRGGLKGGMFFGKEGTDFAAVLGIDQTVLKDELKAGKSLAAIAQEKANLTEDALIQKLTDAETKKLDDAVAAGKLTQEQADKMKSGMADRLKKMVEAKPQAGGMKGGSFGHGAKHQGVSMFGQWGKQEELATILGMTKEDLASELKSGKSLAEIAEAKDMTEDQLITKLKDSMTDSLKKFVEDKGNANKQAAAPTTAQ
ncbi:hypothetical protein [Paenibacillus aestuarii]|uniref:LysM domain-containing protein n=1 Tax=Paenibacillus aestuarii TaxID=516965 RepID=A0ABW0KDZ5_9BACL|nr:hypothetical protein [Paenibacillus aestuarii]